MTWVLLRGLTREARHWGAFSGQFALGLAGEPVVAVDLPGNGIYCDRASPLSARELAEAARTVLRDSGHAPPWRLFGMSLGGMVAADWAQHWPTEVDRLVLVNSSMRPFGSPAQRLRPRAWPALARLALHWPDPAAALRMEQLVYQLTCNAPCRDDSVAAWAQIRATAPVRAGNALRQLLAAARFSCSPLPPPCQVLVLSSAADRLVDPRCSSRLATAWQSAQAQHPWAGHDLTHDDAGWVCAQVGAWLRHGSPPAT
ncbi:MAG: alpha/beta hydrolase [Polaromonas sp.]|nr:alpha/beta hydrolase [Polaromonas sp.]